jgi:hypothetical protein
LSITRVRLVIFGFMRFLLLLKSHMSMHCMERPVERLAA